MMNWKFSSKLVFGVMGAVVIIAGGIYLFFKSQQLQTTTIAGLNFPKNEGAHSEMVREWWFFTSYLKDKTNPKHTFGATLIFFKGANSVQVIVSDFKNQKKYSGRIEDSIQTPSGDKLSIKTERGYFEETDLFQYHLVYNFQAVNLDLFLKSLKDPLIRKSSTKLGIEQTRIEIEGTLNLNDKNYQVNGWGWISHQGEYQDLSPEEISRGQRWSKGWRWWAIQLNNNIEIFAGTLYFYQQSGEEPKRFERLIIFNENAEKEELNKDQYNLAPQYYWEDPRTNYTYPTSWILTIPDQNTNLKINSLMPDQVLEDGRPNYEGICKITGVYQGEKVEGWAHSEAVNVFTFYEY